MTRIAIDFDETLFPTLNKVAEVYNKRHNTTLDLSEVTEYNLYECFDAPVADEILDIFCEKEVYENLQPYKGAVKAVKTLIEQGNEVYVATATSVKNLEWKEQLLQRYFPFIPKDNLIRIYNKKLLNVDILVEDNLENLIQTFADRVCFDQPWNRSDRKDEVYSIYRIHNWGEIINVMKEIERKNEEWDKE